MRKRKRQRSITFVGPLSEPITPQNSKLGDWDDGVKEVRRQRIQMLLDWYGVPSDHPDKWFMLSWRMACELVPGMQIDQAKKRGPKQKWTLVQCAMLVDTIEHIQTAENLTLEAAILRACDGPYRGAVAPAHAASLKARYYEAKERLQAVSVEIRELL